jgi:ABC-type branched-subunit amino acid transport system ATPase component
MNPAAGLRAAAVGLVAGAVPATLVAGGAALRHGAELSGAQQMGLLIAFALAAGFSSVPLARLSARVAVPVTAVPAALAALCVALGAGDKFLVAFAVLGGLATATAAAQAGGRQLAAVSAGWVLVSLATAALLSAGSSWRAVFAVTAVLLVIGAASSAVPMAGTVLEPPLTGTGTPVAFAELRGRVASTPTVRRLLVAAAGLGVAVVPAAHHFLRKLDHDGRSASSAALLSAVVGLAFLAGGALADQRLRPELNPVTALRSVRPALPVAAVLLVLAPGRPLLVAVVGLAVAAAAVGAVASVALSVINVAVPQGLRPVATAYASMWVWGYGTVGGLLLGSAMERRFGDVTTLAVFAAPVLLALKPLWRTAALADADVSRVLQPVADDAPARAGRGGSNLLDCRSIDFSYGPVQVLFDVDFTVDEGEMVALLGTNGAGKSTLLRVVSGLGIPSRGAVRLLGEDITFLDPDRRLRRGVAQIPGGKAVFGPLSVTENMRAYGFVHDRNRKAIERGIEVSFEMFPRLHERRNQNAGTLSGGEQQMLALSKAFILEPRLLLIDELSLGLAPKVVGELLEMVRRINARGTAVVLVEQSVNVALSLVDHAYFMEKGAVQFDGAADDLMERTDLLRSVFLEGAAKGLAR